MATSKDVAAPSHELRRLLQEYNALPDDLTASLVWQEAHPAPTIARRCSECGKIAPVLQLTWDDVRFELGPRGRGYLPEEIVGLCDTCAPEDDEGQQEA